MAYQDSDESSLTPLEAEVASLLNDWEWESIDDSTEELARRLVSLIQGKSLAGHSR